jgi:hypothetical protein
LKSRTGFSEGGAGEGKEFVDEVGHFLDFLTQIVEAGFLFFAKALFEDAEGDLHAGDGRAEFVGDVAEETLLAGDETLEAHGHAIDGIAQGAEFILATFLGADIEPALGDAFGGCGHL